MACLINTCRSYSKYLCLSHAESSQANCRYHEGHSLSNATIGASSSSCRNACQHPTSASCTDTGEARHSVACQQPTYHVSWLLPHSISYRHAQCIPAHTCIMHILNLILSVARHRFQLNRPLRSGSWHAQYAVLHLHVNCTVMSMSTLWTCFRHPVAMHHVQRSALCCESLQPSLEIAARCSSVVYVGWSAYRMQECLRRKNA